MREYKALNKELERQKEKDALILLATQLKKELDSADNSDQEK